MRVNFDYTFNKGQIYHLDELYAFQGLIDGVDSEVMENVNSKGEPEEMGDHCKFLRTVTIKASVKINK